MKDSKTNVLILGSILKNHLFGLFNSTDGTNFTETHRIASNFVTCWFGIQLKKHFLILWAPGHSSKDID